VRYLGEFGWSPVVVTGPTSEGTLGNDDVRSAIDRESLGDVPAGVPVHRISQRADRWPALLAGRLDEFCARAWGVVGQDAPKPGSRIRWRIERLRNALAFPDIGAWRIPAIVQLAMRLHRRHRFDAIFSSGMPFSDHLAALAVQTALRRPWVADFRDPWVEYIHWEQWRSSWGQTMTQLAEAAVMNRATRVVAVNERMTERFSARYESLSDERFVTIENGYDPADFEGARYSANGERFRMLHAGSLYETRRPDTLIAAFGRFIERTPGSGTRAQLEFAGRVGPHLDGINQASREMPVRHVGFLPHSTTLRSMAGSDVSVILLPSLSGSEGDTTAKLYECLGSGRPILAIVPPDGAAARVLKNHDDVIVCHPDDREAIADAIQSLYTRWLEGRLGTKRSAKSLTGLTRRSQAGRLATCLTDAVLAKKHSMRAETCM
jgi:glycosyltransferase involved in cell wall biosynthesis